MIAGVEAAFKTHSQNIEHSSAVFAEVPHCTIRKGHLEEQARTGRHRHRRIGSWISRAACSALCQFLLGKLLLRSESYCTDSKEGVVGRGARELMVCVKA